jgi:anti-sigma regulatory factor (Ser/Thr protein kinase)
MSIEPREFADSDPTPAELTCDLDNTSVSRVRHLVRTVLDGHHGVLLDDAVLVADELVSNAVRHGHGPRTCRLTLMDEGRGLRIEVTDAGSGEPHLRIPDETGGRGLVLVDRLANAWGVHWFPRYKTAWAEMAVRAREGRTRAPHLAIAPMWPRLN